MLNGITYSFPSTSMILAIFSKNIISDSYIKVTNRSTIIENSNIKKTSDAANFLTSSYIKKGKEQNIEAIFYLLITRDLNIGVDYTIKTSYMSSINSNSFIEHAGFESSISMAFYIAKENNTENIELNYTIKKASISEIIEGQAYIKQLGLEYDLNGQLSILQTQVKNIGSSSYISQSGFETALISNSFIQISDNVRNIMSEIGRASCRERV